MVDDLSSMLNLSTERISIWFQNRRARFKKTRKLEVCQENNASTYTPITPPMTSHLSSSSSKSTPNINNTINSYTNLSHFNPNHQVYTSNTIKLDSSQQEYALKTSSTLPVSNSIPNPTTTTSTTSTNLFPFGNQHMNQMITNNNHISFPYSNHSRY